MITWNLHGEQEEAGRKVGRVHKGTAKKGQTSKLIIDYMNIWAVALGG
jgi:hypothetical protein